MKLNLIIRKQDERGISVLLSVLILSSLIVMTVAISDIVLRVGRSSRQIGHSEVAYYAAESGIEKSLYEIEHNRSVDGLDGSSGNMVHIASAAWSLSITPIAGDDPWVIEIEDGESFQLELDFVDGQNTLSYPTTLNVDWTGSPKVIVLDMFNGSQIVHGSSFNLNDLGAVTNLYVLRVINDSGSTINLTLDASGGSLPVGMLLTSTGTYLGQERILEIERSNWQIY